MKTLPLLLALVAAISAFAADEIFFALTPAEQADKAEWIAKGLMHPKYGYDKVSWGDDLDEVKKHYSGLVNSSDEDSLFGLKKFAQNVKGPGIVKREFRFYQGKLFEVRVRYDKSVEPENVKNKLKLTFGEGSSGVTVMYFAPLEVTEEVCGVEVGSFMSMEEIKYRERALSKKIEYHTVAKYYYYGVERKIREQRCELRKRQSQEKIKKESEGVDL